MENEKNNRLLNKISSNFLRNILFLVLVTKDTFKFLFFYKKIKGFQKIHTH